MADSPTLMMRQPCVNEDGIGHGYVEQCPNYRCNGLGFTYRHPSRSEILSAARSHLDYEAATPIIDQFHEENPSGLHQEGFCRVCAELYQFLMSGKAVDAALGLTEEGH